MAPTQVKLFTCPHVCGCEYSTNRSNDLKKHMSTQARHRECTRDCPHYAVIFKIDVETPEGFAAKQLKQPKKSPVPTATTGPAKLLCILDPTRREKSCEDTDSLASWFTVHDLPLDAVKAILGCERLKGYVFPVRREKQSIRVYDWVSSPIHRLSSNLPLTWFDKGVRDVLLLPR